MGNRLDDSVVLPPFLQAFLDEVAASGNMESIDDLNRRVQERCREYNRGPQDELGGLSPDQTRRLIYGFWEDDSGVVCFNDELTIDDVRDCEVFNNARVFLEAVIESDGVKATAAKNLNRKFVDQMLDAMTWPRGFVEDMRKYSKAINEDTVTPLAALRRALEFSGLLRRAKGVFRVTRKGKGFLSDTKAGTLYVLLFKTYFSKLNLAVFDRFMELPDFQHTIAFPLFRVCQFPESWINPKKVGRSLLLPAIADMLEPNQFFDPARTVVECRLLRPLASFGLLETRRIPVGEFRMDRTEYRKAPLFDKFLTFDLDD